MQAILRILTVPHKWTQNWVSLCFKSKEEPQSFDAVYWLIDGCGAEAILLLARLFRPSCSFLSEHFTRFNPPAFFGFAPPVSTDLHRRKTCCYDSFLGTRFFSLNPMGLLEDQRFPNSRQNWISGPEAGTWLHHM